MFISHLNYLEFFMLKSTKNCEEYKKKKLLHLFKLFLNNLRSQTIIKSKKTIL